jgi:serine phosphatase RsbU (regulator of sigma subunit)
MKVAYISEKEYTTYTMYRNTSAALETISEAQDIAQIGVVIPVQEKDYSEFTVIFSNLRGQEQDYLHLGDRVAVDGEPDRTAIKNLWEEKTTEEVVLDPSGEENESATLSVMLPVYVKYISEKPIGILIVVRSIDTILATWKRYIIGIFAMGLGMILIGILMVGLYLRSRVVTPINLITKEADRFAKENFKAEKRLKDKVKSITEIRVLAKSIDKMEEDTVENIEKISQMTRESERLETELSFAADLQRNVLPKGEILSKRKEFDVAAQMNPAREVGGDFYDFFLIDDTHLVLLIADVSDKGMGAAFFMAVAKTLLKGRAGMGGKASEIITYVEEKLSEENENGMFVTVWLGIVDLTTGEVNACNAGHNFPAIMTKESEEGYRIVKTEHGPPICFLPGMGHVDHHFKLHPGDRIFLYTDGVTEAKRPDGERFGNDRLIEALNEDMLISDESLIFRVKTAVDQFSGDEPQYDDMTMLSFTYYGENGNET